MADPAWLEVRAVVRCDPELLDTVRDWLDDSDLVEVNRIDVFELDDDRRHWDGSPATHTLGMPEPCVLSLDLLEQASRLHRRPDALALDLDGVIHRQ